MYLLPDTLCNINLFFSFFFVNIVKKNEAADGMAADSGRTPPPFCRSRECRTGRRPNASVILIDHYYIIVKFRAS